MDISKLNNYIINNIYPTNEGYKYITNQLINFTKNRGLRPGRIHQWSTHRYPPEPGT